MDVVLPPPTPVFAEPGFEVVPLVVNDTLGEPPSALDPAIEVAVGGPVYPPLPQEPVRTEGSAPRVSSLPVSVSDGFRDATSKMRAAAHELTWRRVAAYAVAAYLVWRVARAVRRHATKKNLKKLRLKLKQRIALARKERSGCDASELDP